MRRAGIAVGAGMLMLLAGPPLCAAAEPAASTRLAQAGVQGGVQRAVIASPTGADQSAPLISLLLPLNAPEFAAAANAVQQGCGAALALASPKPRSEIVRTAAGAAGARDAWNTAAAHGAAVIVGPLTRDAVNALAGSLLSSPAEVNAGTSSPPPFTIALNAVDAGPGSAAQSPAGFYSFGLPVEAEAHAAAELAWSDGMRSMLIVQSAGPLGQRASSAFAEAWQARGGHLLGVEALTPGTDLDALRQRYSADGEHDRPEAFFIAANADEARLVRPYLGSASPVYATSQVNDGRRDGAASFDLSGIRFVDMPWLLEPDHPAVMVYPRPETANFDLQRLYALGIDACRMAELLIGQPASGTQLSLDGVTGRLTVDVSRDAGDAASHAVSRQPLPASFLGGAGVVVDGTGSASPQ